ncbi:MAG: trypsin-like serine protease [Solirubrobacteraceae bacterium]
MSATVPIRRWPPRVSSRVVAGALALIGVGGAAPPAAAVIGGTTEQRVDQPWVAPLAEACTATLIAPDRLLTAGHCLGRVAPGRTRVTIGTPPRAHVVAAIARHPRFAYQTDTFPNEPIRDVGLVRLKEPVTGVTPLRLSRTTMRAGARVTLFGFGTDDADRPSRFGRLRRATLRVHGVDACRRRLERAEDGQGAQFRPTLMLCTRGEPRSGARGVAGERSSGCSGDSGAPLLRPRGRSWVVVGVDSWGVACGTRDGDPEVFVRVSREHDWITAADPGWSTEPVGGFER